METLWGLLLDLGVLAVFGGLFYFYQKRKIIRHERTTLINQINQLIILLQEQAGMKTSVLKIEQALEAGLFKDIYQYIGEIPMDKTSDEIKNLIRSIKTEMEFFI